MGRFRNVASRATDSFRGVANRLRVTDKKELLLQASRPLRQPSFIPEHHFQEVSRSSQWLAAVLLAIIIPASLTIIVALDQVMVELFLGGSDTITDSPVLVFIVNLAGLFFLCLAAWSWFIWVRTGGFRLFEL